MSNRKQILISAVLIALALAVVAAFTLLRSDDNVVAATGHDHAAMQAGAGAAKPVSLDAESARRIGVAYAAVESGEMMRAVRIVGSVRFDETRLVNVTPKIEGWVEQLFVDFTGAPVQRGQALMAVYSPMLVAAQEELILAARLTGESPHGMAGENARALLDAARRRLAYWDISADEIARIEHSGIPQRTVTLRAPSSGLVVEKAVLEGARIMPGMDLYRIADLSTVWVEGEVFEKDLGLVAVGREAHITFEAYPGQRFKGHVTYIYPTVSQETRTGRVRIELANPGLRFKPGMYANITFDVRLHLAGLHVPRTAVLTTGTRSIVFVQHDDGSLVPHEVTIGQAAGDHVEILGGLTEGQIVVASASFLVDAESNLGAAMKELSAGTDASAAVRAADAHAAQRAAPAKAATTSTHEGH